jgi:hypothetical protein
VNLSHYEDPDLAAHVADFARYLCFGLKPANWHVNVGRPNFPPSTTRDLPPLDIIAKLLHQAKVSPSVLATGKSHTIVNLISQPVRRMPPMPKEQRRPSRAELESDGH